MRFLGVVGLAALSLVGLALLWSLFMEWPDGSAMSLGDAARMAGAGGLFAAVSVGIGALIHVMGGSHDSSIGALYFVGPIAFFGFMLTAGLVYEDMAKSHQPIPATAHEVVAPASAGPEPAPAQLQP